MSTRGEASTASDGELDESFECVECGACCYSRYDGHVPLTGADHARMTRDEQERYTLWRENTCFMGIVDGHCIALDTRDGLFRCRIYERRPEICRLFERGGDACYVERGRKLPRA